MMADHPTDTARALYDAFSASDGATLSALLGETRWVEAAGMPYGGTHHGLAEIVDKVFGPIGRDVAGFTARPDEILAIGDDRVLAIGTYRGTGAAGLLEVRFAHLMTIADGRITDFEQFADSHQFRKALGD
jgi:ketosteroid isomerase-like protein